jgi:hypothetical protein
VNADCTSPWKAASGSHTGDGRIYVDIGRFWLADPQLPEPSADHGC